MGTCLLPPITTTIVRWRYTRSDVTHFCSPVPAGPLEVRVEVLRHGGAAVRAAGAGPSCRSPVPRDHGARAGRHVVQVYLEPPAESAGTTRPVRSLAAFASVEAAAGAETHRRLSQISSPRATRCPSQCPRRQPRRRTRKRSSG